MAEPRLPDRAIRDQAPKPTGSQRLLGRPTQAAPTEDRPQPSRFQPEPNRPARWT